MRIKRASDQPNIKHLGGVKGSVALSVVRQWGEGAKMNFEARGDPLPVEVNHGRWIASCPYCRGALLMDESEPFFCPDCLMVANGGYARPVLWPENVAEIEAALLARPNPANRNWTMVETVDALRAENLAHGLEV
jgi:hypothetical protein